jgi:hypothetical protein
MKQRYIKPEVIAVISCKGPFMTEDTFGNFGPGGGGANENMFDQNTPDDENLPKKSLWED